MEQQIKCLLERFEQRILTHIKKECPEFAETYDEKYYMNLSEAFTSGITQSS